MVQQSLVRLFSSQLYASTAAKTWRRRPPRTLQHAQKRQRLRLKVYNRSGDFHCATFTGDCSGAQMERQHDQTSTDTFGKYTMLIRSLFTHYSYFVKRTRSARSRQSCPKPASTSTTRLS